jgi:hypothetical protein
VHNYLKVSGNDSLVRDVSTLAIINNNSTEYDNYIKKRNMVESQQSTILRHSDDINTIKQELNEIKQLLLLSINKGNN